MEEFKNRLVPIGPVSDPSLLRVKTVVTGKGRVARIYYLRVTPKPTIKEDEMEFVLDVSMHEDDRSFMARYNPVLAVLDANDHRSMPPSKAADGNYYAVVRIESAVLAPGRS